MVSFLRLIIEVKDGSNLDIVYITLRCNNQKHLFRIRGCS